MCTSGLLDEPLFNFLHLGFVQGLHFIYLNIVITGGVAEFVISLSIELDDLVFVFEFEFVDQPSQFSVFVYLFGEFCFEPLNFA